MRRSLRIGLPLGALALLLIAGSAYAVKSQIGNSGVSAVAELRPRGLPAHGAGAPVTLSTTTRVNTKSGAVPPALKTLTFELDKNGTIQANGLPTCTVAKLEGTTPSQARSRCAGALVGQGMGMARVKLPDQPTATTISSPLSFFNAAPTAGNPTIIAHGYETVPKPKAVVVPIVIERINAGRYGYRAEVTIPPIAEGYGSPILAKAELGVTFKHGGRKVGFINATCPDGRLQVTGKLTFDNGDLFPATLISSCHAAG